MAKNVYDKFGFDRDGYNRDGYDRMGYNREGYDRQGYNKQGVNKNGINKLSGRDKDGYDAEGFNEEGYGRDGYNREGYDKEGFNREGIDAEGYDREGFNIEGYNRDGYNRAGYDAEGYGRDGYSKEGYDRDGFNRDGFDIEGYTRDGFDVYGFDRNGYNKDGFNLNGISEDGYNILGYGIDGFDRDGVSVDGYTKDLFDESGFHIYTGFNLHGFDKDGFNINGFDIDGYDREGYHSVTGYNHSGYDREGYNRAGYNAEGYDRDGYNRNGYDIKGYDRDGYNENGYDEDGYNKAGYDYRGYDASGYDEEGNLDPARKKIIGKAEMDPKQDMMEAAYFKKCVAQIKGYYKDKLREDVLKDYEPFSRTYIDRWGFVQTDWVYPDTRNAEYEVDRKVKKVLKEPYFCHIDYKDDCELYIGRQAIHGWVTDWADKRASLYHQYEIYIGDEKTGLNFVRDIHIVNSAYKGYEDKYNRGGGQKKEILKFTDTHLAKIIAANQQNKRIHDIVESIQQNQYNIITSDKDRNILVLGCAGSGKTMILMHKIRYMRYNNPDIRMDDIMVISPTDILGRESKELSKLLQIEKVQQFTTASFYEACCKQYFDAMGISYEPFAVIDDGTVIEDYYDEGYLWDLLEDVKDNFNSNTKGKQFFNTEQNTITNMMDKHIALLGGKKDFANEMYKLYTSSAKEISQCGKKDIERLIRQIDNAIRERELYELTKDLVCFLQERKCFTKEKSNRTLSKEELSRGFYYTRKACSEMDYDEFSRVRYFKSITLEGAVPMLQLLQLYRNEAMDKEDAYKLLTEWNNISEEEAEEYCKYIDWQLARIERLENKREVLQYILDNKMVIERSIENKNLQYDTSFEKLLQLFAKTEELLEKVGYTPFSYFEEYEKIERKRKRLAEQRGAKGKYQYLFDGILSMLGVTFVTDKEIEVPLTKAFEMIYILHQLFGTCDGNRKYMYIDEFQDFSPIELRMVRTMYPSAVLNVFGDVNQCINCKGIMQLDDIPEEIYSDKYEIKENYRNAREITTYVKDNLNIAMEPYGLEGIQKTVEEIPEITVADDDRVAVIVEDDSMISADIREKMKLNFYSDSKEILRGIYNVIPVTMTKGLEFEKVIVVQRGMDKNQFYVACTRAISELYIVSDNYQDMYDSDDYKETRDEKVENVIVIENKDEQEMSDSSEGTVEVLENTADIQQYKLVPYNGKLKKITGMKHVPTMHISINSTNGEKKIPVCYLVDKQCAYIPEATYKKYENELNSYFSGESNDKFVMPSLTEEQETDDAEKESVRELEVYVSANTSTVNLLDKFEGLGTDAPYERLVIKNAMRIYKGSQSEVISLVVERSKNHDYEGDITFTKFKQGYTLKLKTFIDNQISKSDFVAYKNSGKMFRFSKPYLLRAQNSRNRSGYGWEWDWSTPYAPLVTEGTLYGETTDYVFVGTYIGYR